jgi:glutathione synthase/RimK-type ligase-like ATP-grasp enzyme
LRAEPGHALALVELAALALAGGHVSAARTAYTQAVALDPLNATAQIGLGNLLRNEGALRGACEHYQAALAATAAPAIQAAAHQGLAWAFEALGNVTLAAWHRQIGFTGFSMISRPYRGAGQGTPILLLVSARNGNIPVQGWIDDRHFAVTAIYTEFFPPGAPLPPHALLVNAIGDAEHCAEALTAAAAIAARSSAPVINPPARVSATSRANNACRLGKLPNVIAPKTEFVSSTSLLAAKNLDFPLLLRAPGFHTGQHFTRIDHAKALPAAIAAIPGENILTIQYLDARGPDGMFRKYRVMFIDDIAYPLHLAISSNWKVHYFSAAMAGNAAYRQEERAFLSNMPDALGGQAMTALAAINQTLGLDYAGIDFALNPTGQLLLFEANATMAIVPPTADPVWNYRRPAITRTLEARAEMLRKRVKPFFL